MGATRSPASIRTPPSQGRTCTVGASWDATSASKHDEAWKRIKTAAKKYGVEVNEESWRELGKGKGKGYSK
jgi:hypothetical protein